MTAIFVPKSQNRKIAGSGQVSATYASILGSCPSSCALRGEGCYAEMGHTAIHVRRLDAQVTPGMRPEAVARHERNLILDAFKGGQVPQDGARGGRDLRLHVSGDARTQRAAAILAEAAKDWRERDGGDVWAYTHAHDTVPREVWGEHISVLASIEKPSQDTGGYVPALVVPTHVSERAYTLEGSDTRWIPCPQQTRGVACSDCRLCFDDQRLAAEGFGIAFAVHGSRTENLKKKLTVL